MWRQGVEIGGEQWADEAASEESENESEEEREESAVQTAQGESTQCTQEQERSMGQEGPEEVSSTRTWQGSQGESEERWVGHESESEKEEEESVVQTAQGVSTQSTHEMERSTEGKGPEEIGSTRPWQESQGEKGKRGVEEEEKDMSVDEMDSDEGAASDAQGCAAPCTPTREKEVVEEELSEIGSVRSLQNTQDERTYDGDEQYDEGQRVEAMHASAAEETSNDDATNHQMEAAHDGAPPPTENVSTAESFTGGRVNGNHEQRASRGRRKQGGYDEILNRRGPRRRSGPRIRYVDEGNRSGGTLEQSIRMGPVSVQRVENGETDEQTEAPPPGDPG